jgi:hypothetical protein
VKPVCVFDKLSIEQPPRVNTMFGPIKTIVDQNFVLNAQECHAEHAVLLNAAIKVFNQALSRGRFVRLWNLLRGEPGCLLSLNGRSSRLIGRPKNGADQPYLR